MRPALVGPGRVGNYNTSLRPLRTIAMPLRIQIVGPAAPGSRTGNRVTAQRWQKVLRRLGHNVRVTTGYDGRDADVLIALHARKSARAVREFRKAHPKRPLIVALTGTDLYRDLPKSRPALRSLELADRLVLLQPAGRAALPREARRKARVIYQSVEPPERRRAPLPNAFEVCVIGHLRTVKDPFRTALAARCLPDSSRIRVIQIGGVLQPRMASRARDEEQRNERYQWIGEHSRAQTLHRLARARLMVISSRMEGGANVVGEAAALGIPILASRVAGNVGLLGARHPGYFEFGDTAALRDLLLRAETEPRFYRKLRQTSERIAPLFRPARERRDWRSLLAEITHNG